MDEERKRFETWAATREFDLYTKPTANSTLYAYWDRQTHDSWVAWRAAKADAKAQAEEAVITERERCASLAAEYATHGGSNWHEWLMRLAEKIRHPAKGPA